MDAAAYELARSLSADPKLPVLGWMASAVASWQGGDVGVAVVDDGQLTLPGT